MNQVIGALFALGQDVPWVLSTDLNFGPEDNDNLAVLLQSGKVVDVAKEYGDAEPTFASSCDWAEGDHYSRIDFIFVNRLAWSAVTKY